MITTEHKNHLNTGHYTMPGTFMETMTSRQLRETLLATNNRILACGYSWTISSRPIGAGVHEVRLARRAA